MAVPARAHARTPPRASRLAPVRRAALASASAGRRDLLAGASAGAALLLSPRRALASSAQPVVVLGGTGFVGSRVCAALAARGASVTAVSRSGAPATPVPGVRYVAADVLTADLEPILRGATAVVSCVGVIGGSDASMEAGNGLANARAAAAAKAAGAERFVYVSVSEAVPAALDGVALAGYFAGKREAERAVGEAFGPGKSLVLKPSFVYGGDAFSVAPPRVPDGYGSLVEKALSSGPARAVAAATPPAVALTLAPPIPVADVAGAAAAGALGLASGAVDGHDAIREVAGALPAV